MRHAITPADFTSFIGGLLCWQAERFGTKLPRWIALLAMGITLFLSLYLWMQGNYSLVNPKGVPDWQEQYFRSGSRVSVSIFIWLWMVCHC